MTSFNPGPNPSNRPELDHPNQREKGFGWAIAWTFFGALIPGSGLLKSRHRAIGGIAVALFAIITVSIAAAATVGRNQLAQLAVNPTALTVLAAVLIVVALAWDAVIVGTHLSLRPAPATTFERMFGGIVVGTLCFAVAAPLTLAADYAFTTATAINQVFDDDPGGPASAHASDPWQGVDRINLLIIGGDSGVKSNRSTSVGARTDTVIVASLNPRTGSSTLITMPRNAEHMPFPPGSPLRKYYPNGFYKPGAVGMERAEYLLNAMYRNVPAHVPANALGKTKDLGASALMQSVGYALGLDIKYYVFVNMDGFKDFVNAIGGITVNVNYAVPIGGHNASGNEPEEKPAGWIEPGPNTPLKGAKALWFARGRYHLNDYSRMERQRCVVYAVSQQATPQVVLTNYESIVKTGVNNLSTNIPRSLLPALADVALKVKSSPSRSLVLDPANGFLSYRPNWAWVRTRVQRAIAESAAAPTPAAPRTPDGSAPPHSASTPGTHTKSDDLSVVCSYHPQDYHPTQR